MKHNTIKSANGKETLNYLRPTRHKEEPSGFIYVHNFGTGFQELVFTSHDKAQNFFSKK